MSLRLHDRIKDAQPSVTVVGTDDTPAPVYVAGCFDPEKIIVADGYQLTDKDKDALRVRGIYLCDKIN